MKSPIPVLMYHSVGRVTNDWRWSVLTTPARVFESHLKWLAKTGYKTAGLDQLRGHVSGNTPLDPRTVVLTLDDGYVDNWTYAVPLLKKYKLSATVFVNPEFVDPRDVLRPTIEDVWAGKTTEDDIEVRGFMSWPELRAASSQGILSIQSHGMTHTSYPVSSEIVDFHHPNDGYYWLDWNERPEGKPFYRKDPTASEVPWGTPVYRNMMSLEATRYIPDPNEVAHFVNYVRDRGGTSFFETKDWRQALYAELSNVRASNDSPGSMENSSQRRARQQFELAESKRRLEDVVGVTVDSFCWPGGAYDEVSFQMAKQIYKSITLGSRGQHLSRNARGDDPALINRCGAPYITHGRWLIYMGGRYLVWFLDEFRQVPFARQKRQLMKILCTAGTAAGIWPDRSRKILTHPKNV